MHQLLLLAPLMVMLVAAAAVDFRFRRIPNWLTLGLAAGGLTASIAWQSPVVGWWESLLGLALGFAMNLPLFALGIRGGGDVKLFAAVGAWIGPVGIIAVFIVSTVIALLLALIQAASHRRLRPVLANSVSLTIGLAHGSVGVPDRHGRIWSADRHLPYAVPVAISVAVLLAAG